VIRSLLFALFTLISAAAALSPAPAQAHEYRPTLLRFDVVDSGLHSVVWKWDGNDPNGVRAADLVFEGCEAGLTDESVGVDQMTRIALQCPGSELRVIFPHPVAEIVIDARRNGHPVAVRRIRGAIEFVESATYGRHDGQGEDPNDDDEEATDGGMTLSDWVRLGAEHIAEGWDHLSFVLALALLVGTWRRVALVITGFTIGHSITLGLTSLGTITPPSSGPVEAVIALSVVYLAVEMCRGHDARAQFAGRRGIGVAAGFGLIHGFGFAGVLRDLGLPPGSEWRALLGFNIGVELGQLTFVALILAGAYAIGRAMRSSEPVPTRLRLAGAYVVGSLAVFWTLQRAIPILFA
jgi:hypothetical protein